MEKVPCNRAFRCTSKDPQLVEINPQSFAEACQMHTVGACKTPNLTSYFLYTPCSIHLVVSFPANHHHQMYRAAREEWWCKWSLPVFTTMVVAMSVLTSPWEEVRPSVPSQRRPWQAETEGASYRPVRENERQTYR